MAIFQKYKFLVEKSRPIFNVDQITLLSRNTTFKEWMYEHIQNSKDLADCGFYARKDRDLVQCFYCGIVLGCWTIEDSPWIEHYRHSKDCTYINLNKTRLESKQSLHVSLENSATSELDDGIKLILQNLS
jgi:hypothetical protein